MLKHIRNNVVWELPEDYKGCMKVPGRIYATEKLIDGMEKGVFDQVANVACLPGIYGYSIALPDAHYGYGFPIGGVAAFDVEEGVVSPGGVGYDINCLAPGTKILTEHGCWVKVEDLPKMLTDQKLKVYDVDEGREDDSEIKFVMERGIEEDERAVVLVTESGLTIEGSEDHPVLTPEGYVELGEIEEGDLVVVYPFEGVEYEEKEGTILDESDFEDVDPQVLRYLEERDLIPLRWSDPKVGTLARILGFAMGDGHLGEQAGRLTLSFYGDERTLRELKRDLESLGVKANLHVRKRRYEIETASGRYEGEATSVELRVASRSFALLMEKLGMPRGRKVETPYKVPDWIKEAPLWVKRNFLAGLFAADGSVVKFKRYTPLPINLTQAKVEELEENLREFMNDVAKLLREFGIETTLYEVKSKKNVVYKLAIVGEENIKRFLGKVGYEYDPEKKVEGLAAYAYLKLKERVKKDRKEAAETAAEVYEETGSITKAHEAVADVVNRRFVERVVYDGGISSVRVPEDFPTFERFKEERVLAGGFVIEEVVEVKGVEPEYDRFYDIGVCHGAHNFIADGVVVHNCGVRVMKTDLTEDDVRPKLRELLETIFRNVPAGLGSRHRRVRLSTQELRQVMLYGAEWAVEEGFGFDEDLDHIESRGNMTHAYETIGWEEYGPRDDVASKRAIERGRPQLGTLGSGNHFLEVQVVDEIYDKEAAEKMGIREEGQVTIMVHTGSRGFGHQVCSDHLRIMERSMRDVERRFGVRIPDRQLACAAMGTDEAKRYFNAMNAAANYAFANRQMISHWTRESFVEVFGDEYGDADDMGIEVIYDIAHNMAKIEKHPVDGEERWLVVHRKGATRAFSEEALKKHGEPVPFEGLPQPVLIPGDMGTGSYILIGTEKAMEETWGSTCHGAGRTMSRAAAKRKFWGEDVARELERQGILVKAASMPVVAEEAPPAYKDVDEVVRAVAEAGISDPVVRLRPIGVVKG
ncbi:intein-containing RctB family protein [Methanopyrus kandleri]|nr:RNA-splicing ligase RtcB [Methanopyrus kandleri]